MKVRLVNPANAPGLIDPVTRRSPFIDPQTGAVVLVANVPETNFWVRRELGGEIVRENESAQPTGDEPVKPLTKR